MKEKQKNKFLIIMLTCMIALSSVWAGRTYAYFSASNNASGTITMGTLQIDSLKTKDDAEINWDIAGVVPNQEIGGSYKAVVNSDINYYTRILFKATVTPKVTGTHSTTCADHVDDDIDILSIAVSGNDSTYKEYGKDDDGNTIYYKMSPTTPTASTTDENFNINLRVHDWVGNGGCDYYMGATITLNMQVEVIQADYLESDTTGTSYTDVTAIHNKWTKRVNVVTLSGDSNCYFYYAIDGESEWYQLEGDQTIEIDVESKILLKIAGGAYSYSSIEQEVNMVTPRWDVAENIFYAHSWEDGDNSISINRSTTQSVSVDNQKSIAEGLDSVKFDNVSVPVYGTSYRFVLNGDAYIIGTASDACCYCLLPIYENTTIKLYEV